VISGKYQHVFAKIIKWSHYKLWNDHLSCILETIFQDHMTS